MSVALTVFVVANVGISAGYGYAAASVAPRLGLPDWWARLAGAAFLGLCALTHLEQAAHALDGTVSQEVWGSWHMLTVHVLQFPAIWLFAHGVSRHLRAAAGR